MKLKHIIATFFTALLGLHVYAQPYPSRPISIVVPFSPGGVTDVMVRLVASKLQEELGQPVVVVNRTGAGTTIATNFVSKAEPDGYTILVAASSFTIAPSLYKEQAGYDPEKDFKPISLLATVPHILVVNPALPINDVASLIQTLREGDPRSANYGSSGPGTSNHLEGELFSAMAGITLTHIPFKGSVPALTAIAGNDVSFLFVDVAAAKPFLDSGRVKALAVTTPERSTLLPHLPTVDESGLKSFNAMPWLGLVVPSNTPDEIMTTLGNALTKIKNDPHVHERFAVMGLEPVFNSTTEFRQFIQSESLKWEDVIRRAQIGTGS